ncbi:AtpZ/AtpI family protein [Rhodohalobacter mucosus]|uniref:AtpZ/AtpI family protein n=1 Tax=Rhodohalobacter mucosus TaxID=2079485 RepID=UPI001304CB2F|nr:AtpZ/AtpI family protein [Rhodohalobacter mucosus]
MSFGTEIAVAVGAPILLGYWLDTVFDTSPYLTLSGVLLAVILFILMLIRLIRKLNEE